MRGFGGNLTRWFGTASAWAALVLGLAFAALAALQLSWGSTPWVLLLAAAALLTGAVRTLRKMSGGLRLLAGAWGLGAGLALAPMTLPTPQEINPNTYAVAVTGFIIMLLPLITLAGLALTVLHKEK